MKKTIRIITCAGVIVLGSMMATADDAKAVYEKSCAACHGKDGKGDTPAGKKMGVKDYTDAKAQAEMKDEDMIKAIKEGIKDGDKTKMKAFGDKLTDDEIKMLVAYVRSFKK